MVKYVGYSMYVGYNYSYLDYVYTSVTIKDGWLVGQAQWEFQRLRQLNLLMFQGNFVLQGDVSIERGGGKTSRAMRNSGRRCVLQECHVLVLIQSVRHSRSATAEQFTANLKSGRKQAIQSKTVAVQDHIK